MSPKDSLKDQIEKRVNELTRKPRCSVQRAVLFLFENTTDYKKSVDCLEVPDSGIDYVSFENEDNVVSVLQKQLDIYKKNINKRELSCPEGIYVLVGSNDIERWKESTIQDIQSTIFRYFDKVITEFSILRKPKDDLSDFHNCFIIKENAQVWIVDYDNLSSIQMLLDNARYSVEPFGRTVGREMKSNPLVLRLDESNAVRQEMSVSFLKALHKQTEPKDSSEIKNEVQDYLFPIEYRRRLSKQIPSINWLPILGYEELVKKLEKELSALSWKNKISRIFKRQPMISKYTISEVLDILFASKGNQIRTERIRQSIREEVIPNVCQDYLNSIKKNVQTSVFQRFSLHDIVYELRNYLLEYQEDTRKVIKEEEQKLEGLLETKFSYISTEIADIYGGLEEYFSAFSRLCKNYIEYTWWEVLANFVGECENTARKELAEFEKAETVFKLSLIDKSEDLGENTVLNMHISDMKDLSCKLESYSKNVSLSLTDILSIMRAKDKCYGKTNDFHVNKEEQPHIYMMIPSAFITNNLELVDNTRSLDFTWDILFEDYMPSQLSYQIRVYNWI